MADSTVYEEDVVPVEEQREEKDVPTNRKPSIVNRSVASIVLDYCLDIFLLTLSVLFFAFGLTIRSHDKVPVATHPRLANSLLGASKVVSRVFEDFSIDRTLTAETGTDYLSNPVCMCLGPNGTVSSPMETR